jgi:DNA mismatch endonuclease (patch repair protein)
MTDVLTPAQRSFNMSRVRGRDTRPEMSVRRALHRRGFRFRLHVARLPGRPDLVLAKYMTAVLVQGCFWHGHGCHMTKMPNTRREFWNQKINGNVARDASNLDQLRAAGWRVLIIWECALRGRSKLDQEVMMNTAATFIRAGIPAVLEIAGAGGRVGTLVD